MSVFMAYNKYTWYSVIRSHNFIAAWKARFYSVWKVSLDSDDSSLQDDGITYGDSDIFNHASRSRYTPMFFTPSLNLFLGRRNKVVSIHDILKKARVLPINLGEGQYQDSDANVHSWYLN